MCKLTPKQRLFCAEYLKDLNLTQSAIRAGYKAKYARQMGRQNYSKPYIQERIQKLMAEREARTLIDADWVLTGIKELTEDLRLSDDPKAAYKGYELGGRHLQLFIEKSESKVEQVIRVMADDDVGIPD